MLNKEKIFNTIRTRICTFYYAPDERLSEMQLSNEFNISRTPIREVLSLLEDHNFLTVKRVTRAI